MADPRVKFLARGVGRVLFITASEAVLADRRTGQAMRVHLRGSRPDVEVAGLEPLPGRIHYIRGRDHAMWRSGVTTYRASPTARHIPALTPSTRPAPDRGWNRSFWFVRPILPRSVSSAVGSRHGRK